MRAADSWHPEFGIWLLVVGTLLQEPKNNSRDNESSEQKLKLLQ